jgi:DNA-binding CsgD family transcriptional regulator
MSWCAVCVHPRAREIALCLEQNRLSLAQIARIFGLKVSALKRHVLHLRRAS